MRAVQTSKVRAGRGTTSPTPAAPLSVTATKISESQINLSWADPADSVALNTYKVWRALGAGSYSVIATVQPVSYPLTAAYQDIGLPTGSYTYRVSCVATSGVESAYTQSAQITLSSTTPTVVFGWKPFVTDGYSIGDYSEADGGTFNLSSLIDIPPGVSPTYSEVSDTSGGVSIDAGTGIVTIPPGLSPTLSPFSLSVSVNDNSVGADWASRSAGAGVIWAHRMDSATEFSKFLVTNAGYPSTYPAELIPARVYDNDIGAYCVQHTNIGTTLAGAINSTQTTITVTDASTFPDPAALPSPFGYTVCIQDPAGSASVVDSLRERVFVTGKSGNTLTVIRGSFSRSPAKAWNSGMVIGWDSEGTWARPLAAFPATMNGMSSDDPAANGSVTKRSWSGPNNQTSWKQGYYGHAGSQAKWPTWNGVTSPWDGDEFYLQFRVKISDTRWDPANLGSGKLFFVNTAVSGGNEELVSQILAPDPARNDATTSFKWYTSFGTRDNSKLTNPQMSDDTALYQPGSEYGTAATTCTVGDHASCWQWSSGEWITLLIRFKPGRHCPYKFGDGTSNPVPLGAIKVDTSTFTPTNNGTYLEFETNTWTPVDRYEVGGINTNTTGYFDGWRASFPQATGEFSGLSMKVTTHTVGSKVRWKLERRTSTSTMPAGVPAHNTNLMLEWLAIENAQYRETVLEAWAARAGQPYTKLYSMNNLAWLYGDAFVGDIGTHPLGAVNIFRTTSYQNCQDGTIPPAKTYNFRFAEFILSKNFIPAPSVSLAPKWFNDLPDLTWSQIAKGTTETGTGGNRLDQATLQPGEAWPNDVNDPLYPQNFVGPQTVMKGPPNDYCQNTNGMSVDQETGECFLVANGGHQGYQGNETMRLDLKSTTPGWARIVDATPPWYITLTNPETVGTLSYHCYLDGPGFPLPAYSNATSVINRRPVTMHTAAAGVYSEGKVWFPCQNATFINGSTSTLSKVALNVQSVRDDPSLKLWKYGNIAPWEYHGVVKEFSDAGLAMAQASWYFPVSLLDRSTGRIWVCPSGSNNFWMMETRGPNAGKHQAFRNSTVIRPDGSCGGDVTTGVLDQNGVPIKLGVVYGWKFDAKEVWVLDITALEASTTITYSGVLNVTAWTKYTATDETPMRWINSERAAVGDDPAGTWGAHQCWGAFWHEASQGLLMFNCDHAVDISRGRNGHIRKLSLPLLSGKYNPAGAWVFKNIPISIPVGGQIPDTCSPTGMGAGGSLTRFNVVRNFDGVGNDLVVNLSAYDKPTYVFKLPVQGV